jgi:PAS domain-containing protein
VGLLVLAGSFFDVEVLKRISPRFVAMNPVTAICFVLIGIAFECLRPTKPSTWGRSTGVALALLAAFVGAIKVGSYVLGWPVQIDALLFGLSLKSNAPYSKPDGTEHGAEFHLRRCGVVFDRCGATAVPCQPCSRAIRERDSTARDDWVCVRSHAVYARLGSIYSDGIAHRFRFSHFICWHSAAATRHRICANLRGEKARAVSRSAAVAECDNFYFSGGLAATVRRMKRVFPGAIGTASFAVTMIFGLIALIWWTVASLNRAEEARIAAEVELRRSQAELRASLRDLELVMNHASELIFSIDDNGRVISVNAA